jgi:hypothetical protein
MQINVVLGILLTFSPRKAATDEMKTRVFQDFCVQTLALKWGKNIETLYSVTKKIIFKHPYL